VSPVFINPGARIPTTDEAVGWTNTHAKAAERSAEWESRMTAEGFDDIEVTDTGIEENGRWQFAFRHRITGKVVTLEQHGIDDLPAYEKQHIFAPRVYWNDSSSAEPSIEDFRADGFVPVITYKASA
jgi:hypothetical protein